MSFPADCKVAVLAGFVPFLLVIVGLLSDMTPTRRWPLLLAEHSNLEAIAVSNLWVDLSIFRINHGGH